VGMPGDHRSQLVELVHRVERPAHASSDPEAHLNKRTRPGRAEQCAQVALDGIAIDAWYSARHLALLPSITASLGDASANDRAGQTERRIRRATDKGRRIRAGSAQRGRRPGRGRGGGWRAQRRRPASGRVSGQKAWRLGPLPEARVIAGGGSNRVRRWVAWAPSQSAQSTHAAVRSLRVPPPRSLWRRGAADVDVVGDR